MIKRFLHIFGNHDWNDISDKTRDYQERECLICDRCEMQMADGSWAQAHGTEFARKRERERVRSSFK